jgi:hypothetical protein
MAVRGSDARVDDGPQQRELADQADFGLRAQCLACPCA